MSLWEDAEILEYLPVQCDQPRGNMAESEAFTVYTRVISLNENLNLDRKFGQFTFLITATRNKIDGTIGK